MTTANREIYSNALVHMGALASNSSCHDYEERAPYIIANFCAMSRSIDAKIRKCEGLEAAAAFNHTYMFLEADFPLCEKMLSPAVFYLAAMLVIDDDPELSDMLYGKYCDVISEITMSLSCKSESILDKYFGN